MSFRRLKIIFKNITLTLPVTVAFMDCVGYAAKVEGSSMQPLLNPDTNEWSDIVFLNRTVTFDFSTIKRGDVIAVTSPRDPSQKLIKRVIALQGDSVKSLRNNNVVHIPPGHCWLEGDNHKHSFDSNHFGPVSIGLAVAKATYILWPPKRFGPIESELPADRQPIHKHVCQQCFQEDDMREELSSIFV